MYIEKSVGYIEKRVQSIWGKEHNTSRKECRVHWEMDAESSLLKKNIKLLLFCGGKQIEKTLTGIYF